MEVLDTLLTYALELTPTAIAVVGVVLFLFAARFVLRHRYGGQLGSQFKIQLTTLVLVFLGLLVIILALPISDTKTGQLLGLIGILLSAAIALSATTFVGNVMAGLMLRAVRSFRPGDFVRVGDHFGRISEQGLFHVELQTEDRDLTTLPNLYLVTNPVKVTRSDGTFVSADLSLGYDMHHHDIQTTLVEAARAAGLKDPFAHVITLGDFSVTYRVSGLLSDVKTLVSTRSRLREAILDHLHRGGIEIVSPTFMNQRVWPTERQFVPTEKAAPAGPAEGKAPDSILFDKADEAESLEKMQERYKLLCDELKELKNQVDSVEADQKDRLKERIETLESRKERLAEYIKHRQEEG